MAKKRGKDDAKSDVNEGEAAAPKPQGYSGSKLRSIRESKGLTIVDISSMTKISKAVLQALEEERYADMPNARVYVRGFVRCVARELELDLDAVSKSYLPGWERWAAEHEGTHY